ncbi:MAG: hypothetical protein HPY62_10890 [Bacteroidales bacterium]|nr:hypothetical protein [Bacteroidales bacterium]
MTLDLSYRRILHRMGYYEYQQGLILSHIAQEGGWNSHLMNCRKFIMASMEFFKPEIVTVLGSGWLLDIPLEEMLGFNCRINLVDIIHPPQVIEQVAGIEKVKLIEDDVSAGLILRTWKMTSGFPFKKKRTFLSAEIPLYRPEFETGLVVSANILTQIESLPVRLIRKRIKARDEDIYDFRKRVQERHLEFLAGKNAVLISDISEITEEKTGKIIEEPTLLTVIPEARFKEEWKWNFEPVRPDFYRKKSIFRVVALAI